MTDRADVNDPATLADFRDWFERYERALVANDVEALGALFLDADHVVRFGPAESLYGWGSIQAFRRARPAVDLAREPLRVTLTTYGLGLATAAAEFRRTGSGVHVKQTQTWVRTGEGWRIVQAHVSTHPGGTA